MLTLTHGCSCDVCAEEYGAQRPPHSIPCGHVLCASCCTAIIEKCPPRQVPSCPFCRIQFSHDQIRMIRMDFTTSGWSTPRRFPTVEPADSITGDLLARRTERLLSTDTTGMSKTRLDARRLEDKVAKVAAKKCSVEEVAALHKELEDWLLTEKEDQTSSLYLSAALLRAILMNHMAHSEVSKAAKSTEHTLKRQVQELEDTKRHLEGEMNRIHAQFTAKSQECQSLRSEITHLKSLAHSLGAKPDALPPSTPHAQLPTPPSTSPTPYSQGQSFTYAYTSSTSTSTSSASSASTVTPLSPVSRFHSRSSSSASAALASRPQTPAAPSMSASRSHTPSAPSVSTTFAPTSRSSASTSMPSTPTRPSTSASMSSASASPTRPSTSTGMRTSSASASAAAHRPSTPGHGLRTYTPAPAQAPPVPTIPARYATTPSPMRSHTSHGHHSSSQSQSYSTGYSSAGAYAPAPLIPPKPRRLSTSQAPAAPKLGRTVSEEKADAHERWLPPGATANASFTYGSTDSGRDREYGRDSGREREKEYSRERNGGYGERGIVNDYEKDPRKTPRPPSRVSASAGAAGFMGFSSAAYAATRLKDLSGRA